ncbi:MAG: acetylornithine/succinylornithine family transaminase [Gammaproteobacteria bacterium]|nr:acetylornithine/succinylornithine family transaminase [Gammaproteobacteria bacterium]MDD9871568.1 acetylornithine/succinylornithine family transaminase [Gammaproteobacteria bacterium]
MNQEKLKAAARRLFVPNYAAAAIVLERGRGCRVWDGAGSEYLDFGAGISVNSLGHCNAGVTQAVTNQAAALNHVSNLYYNRPSIALAEKLLGACFAERVFFCNSGSEANEAAIKLARKFSSLHHANHKREIVTFSGAFHGRTLAALTATANPAYQEGFGPLPGGFVSCAFNDFAAAEKTIGAKTCAVMVEPVQGESGIHPAAPGFLGHLRNLCDRHNALLVVDEIQCGLGRTGNLFAHQWPGPGGGGDITPDIMTLAKALGGGLPIGAMLATARAAEALQPGSHGSTFGGNPVACAAACAVFDQINDDALLQKVRRQGGALAEFLRDTGRRHGLFAEVRGRGLMLGAQLTAAHAGRAADLMECCRRHGILTLAAGKDVLRLLPPLNLGDAELEEGMSRIARAAEDFAREVAA